MRINKRWFWLTAIAAIVAVSTMIAAITVVTLGNQSPYHVLVHTIEMSDAVARLTVVNVALAMTFAEISLLSFLFVWDERHLWRVGARPRMTGFLASSGATQ